MDTDDRAEALFEQSNEPSFAKLVFLAALFAIFSLTGLFLLPSHVDGIVVLRGAGVAIAAHLLIGRKATLSVLMGAVAVQIVLITFGYTDITSPKETAGALAIVLAMPLQARLAYWLITRCCGLPLVLRGYRRLGLLALAVLPAVSTLVPTIGVAEFNFSNSSEVPVLLRYWIFWWIGDVLGIYMAVPVAVLGPWNKRPLVYWKNVPLPRFTPQPLLYVALAAAISLASWIYVSRMNSRATEAQFASVVAENVRNLTHRLETYQLALNAGVGFFQGSDNVSAADWGKYVESLTLSNSLSGLNGVGFIQPVGADEVDAFLEQSAADGIADFQIKPEISTNEMFVIKYIEPNEPNLAAVGLNIAFEDHRKRAAELSRDMGETQVTLPIVLVQDSAKSPGFLMMTPLYSGPTPETVDARREQFIGWIYAPVIASKMFTGLTASLDRDLFLTVYDNEDLESGSTLYSNFDPDAGNVHPRYRIVETHDFYGRSWSFIWESTPAFEAKHASYQPLVLLIGGLSFAFLLAVLLLNLRRREELVNELVAQRTRELAALVEENRSIIETSVAKIALLDGEGVILRVNSALVNVLGRDERELIGLKLGDLLHGSRAKTFNARNINDTMPAYRDEMTALSSSGELLTFEVQVKLWKTSANEKRLTAVMRNITDQRHVEHRLRKTQHRLNLALTGAKIGVFDIDLRTGHSVVSQTWRDLLGVGGDEEIDNETDWRKRVHPDDLPLVDAADRDCIEGRTLRSISEYRFLMPDGSWRWMRSDAVGEERDTNGRARRLVGLQSDVTDQRQVEELKKQFVSTVSHELRTPLTSINGSLSLLLNAMSDGIPDTARRMLMIAQKNCDRLINLVNDILDLEKLDAGPQSPKLSAQNLSAQVRRALQVNEPYAARFGVQFVLCRDQPDVTVRIEEQRFQQVLTNLLSNAAKFSTRGDAVEIAIDVDGEYAIVSVTDHGPGIPAEFQDRLFKAFSQADGSVKRRAEGTGLGLYISRKIAEQLQGEIGFRSEPGVSTTFWVKLALGTASDEASVRERAEFASGQNPDALRILHLETDQDFAEVIARAFEPEANLVNVVDERAALDRLEQDRFDLILLDCDESVSRSKFLETLPQINQDTPVVVLGATERAKANPRVALALTKSRVMLDEVVKQCLAMATKRSSVVSG